MQKTFVSTEERPVFWMPAYRLLNIHRRQSFAVRNAQVIELGMNALTVCLAISLQGHLLALQHVEVTSMVWASIRLLRACHGHVHKIASRHACLCVKACYTT